MSLEPLNNFLAYLQRKSWEKKIDDNVCTHKPQSRLENTPFLNGHHSPADRARELFKTALDGEGLVF